MKETGTVDSKEERHADPIDTASTTENEEQIVIRKIPKHHNVIINGTKAQKGRLKKLVRKASTEFLCENVDSSSSATKNRKRGGAGGSTGTSFLGLTSGDDWEELRALIDLKASPDKEARLGVDKISLERDNFGPSVILTNHDQENNRHEQQCDGSHVRNILMTVLCYNNKLSCNPTSADHPAPKKHKQETVNPPSNKNITEKPLKRLLQTIPPMPNWARIHNPACIANCAVIEFTIHRPSVMTLLSDLLRRNGDDDDDDESSRPSAMSKLLHPSEGLFGRKANALLNIRLFQGDRVKTLSEVLFYLDPPAAPLTDKSKKSKQTDKTGKDKTLNSGQNNIKSPHDTLKGLLLSTEKMKKEGYPMITSSNSSEEESSSHDCQLMLSPTTNTKPYNEQIKRLKDVALKHATDNNENRPKWKIMPFSQEQAMEIVSTIGLITHINTDQNINSTETDASSATEYYVPTILSRFDFMNMPVEAVTTTSTTTPLFLPQVYAMDCEMVKTSRGQEVARVTLLLCTDYCSCCDGDAANGITDKGYETVLDVLVKPRGPILDYLTEYSGITPQILSKVSTRLEEVQALLLLFICKEDILLGHSLENDFRVLKLVHENVVDTAVIFQGNGGKKHALRHLSNVLLNRKIQQSSPSGSLGHCSVEDASASLTLALKRATLGNDFRIHVKPGRKNIMEFIAAVQKTASVTADAGPLVCVGPHSWISRHIGKRNPAHALECDDITSSKKGAVLSWLKSASKKRASLLWANLAVGRDAGTASGGNQIDRDEKANASREDRVMLRQVDHFIEEIVKSVPKSTVLLFCFQQGTDAVTRTSQQRKASKDPRSSLGWTASQEHQWERDMDACRSCLGFFVGMA